jgi:sporulation protein YlmC with PRC-barrel domain
VRGRTASSLLGLPVAVRGIRLGKVEAVLLDREAARIIGLEVGCGDGASRFLPFSTARESGAGIEIDSTLTLLDPPELAFYRSRSRSLASAPELAHARIGAHGALDVPVSGRW